MKHIFTLIFLLSFLPCYEAYAVTPAAEEFTKGDKVKFSTDGHPKSKGINISTVVFCHCWRPYDTLRPSPTPA